MMHLSGFQEHNIHTKFCENLTRGSQVKHTHTHTHPHTQLARFHKTTLFP
jgi:hypothetical protein